ncbi:hypothetical protein IB642_04910 [Allofrancisella guangzhouensis]|uniref:Uncharacterized protein n=2 Tax=Allofrancisella guangzhouensis TaxID=594679 RepID=A0A0A8E2L2_9GAMM|nr:calcium-binding protein [Allofrancisella guangzhouensis]AJC48228.1 hypothetical protein SD28_00390 [Allofrancisella guangzhouensis]MBK2044358.1 hypothetical protein [Allofrancisella guangzhouensis]MBK2046442.1 hypothetical protein [Allofrancisella guangzhouensis]
MSNTTSTNQLETNLNDAIQATSNKNAVFDRLIYSNVFEGNIKVGSDGKPLSLGKQFYETDAKGNFVTNADGSYIIRDGLDAGTASYLMNNSTLVDSLDQYNIVKAESNSLNGFTGMAISHGDNPDKVIFSSRGTEPSQINDLVADAILAVNEYSPIEISNAQVNSANEFVKSVLDTRNTSTEVIFTGHSLGGYLAQVQAAYTDKTYGDNISITQVDTFNAPQAGEYIRSEYGSEVANSINNVAYSHITVGDVVSRSGNISGQEYVIGQVMMYSNTDGGPASHSITYFTDANQSTFNTTLLSETGELVVENLAEILSTLDAQSAALRQEISSMDRWDRAISQVANELGVASVDNPYAKLDSIIAVKAGLEKMLSNIEGYETVANNYASILENYEFIQESLGGEQGDAIVSNLAEAVSDQSIEVKEQFVESLKDNSFIKGIIETALGLDFTTAQNVLLDQVYDIAERTRSAERVIVRRGDPLTFDLDGDGIETIAVEDGVLFDHAGHSVKHGTGWVSADDGLLVRDIDGNGTIDSGRELFGDNTIKEDGSIASNGFDALRELDTNADGVFDIKDEEFEKLQIWQDKNQDGISQQDELSSLSEAGIKEINLNATRVVRNTAAGNITHISSFTKTDGTTAEVGNLFLDREPAIREFVNDTVEASAEIQELGIEIKGIGRVRSLSKAASLDDELGNILKEMKANPIESFKDMSKVGVLISEWTRSTDFSDTLKIENLKLEDGTTFKFDISDKTRRTLEKIQTLEALTDNDMISMSVSNEQLNLSYGGVVRSYAITRGQENILTDEIFVNTWSQVGGVTGMSTNGINSLYNDVVRSIETSIFKQVAYPEILSKLDFTYNTNGNVIDVDFSRLNEYIYSESDGNIATTVNLVANIKSILGEGFSDYKWDYNKLFEGDSDLSLLSQLELNQFGTVNSSGIVINGKRLIIGSSKDADIETTLGENNIVIGGAGNDIIHSNYMTNDTIVYNLGDGLDTIKQGSYNYSSRENTADKVIFGEGISLSNLSFRREEKDLIININNDESQGLILENYYVIGNKWNDSDHIKSFEFSDGTVIYRDDKFLSPTYYGTQGDDTIQSTKFSETIIAGKGDDLIRDDGEVFEDGFYNYYSDDSADTIIYNLGDGFDTIISEVSYKEARDTLVFGEGISLENLSFIRDGNDLTININNDVSQGVKIRKFFYSSKIKDIKLADGTILDKNSEQINSPIIGTDGDDIIYTGISDDVIEAGRGDDIIRLSATNGASYGSYREETNSYLNKDTSKNTIKYSLGDGFDTLIGGSNTLNTISFGEGITQDDLSFKKDGSDLIIQVGDDITQGLKVRQFYSGRNNLTGFEFADGSVLYKTDIKIDTDADDVLVGNNDNIITGNDTLKDGEGSDTYVKDVGDNLAINDTQDGDRYILTRYYQEQARERNATKVIAKLADGSTYDFAAMNETLRMLRDLSIAEYEAKRNQNQDTDIAGGALVENHIATELDNSEILEMWAPKSSENG